MLWPISISQLTSQKPVFNKLRLLFSSSDKDVPYYVENPDPVVHCSLDVSCCNTHDTRYRPHTSRSFLISYLRSFL